MRNSQIAQQLSIAAIGAIIAFIHPIDDSPQALKKYRAAVRGYGVDIVLLSILIIVMGVLR